MIFAANGEFCIPAGPAGFLYEESLLFSTSTGTGEPPRSCGTQIAVRMSTFGGHMKDSTKDKVEGAAHELKGKVKEKLGKAKNDPDLAAEGTDERLGGKIQKKIGDIEKVFEK